MKKLLIILMFILVLSGGWWFFVRKDEVSAPSQDSPDTRQGQSDGQALRPEYTDYVTSKGVTIRMYAPQSDDRVGSPLRVSGEVPGSWSFEASFPVRLLDADGAILAEEAASLQGDWMTDAMVPFSLSLTYGKPPADTTGKLILQKDNPSGLPDKDDSLEIPVRFE